MNLSHNLHTPSRHVLYCLVCILLCTAVQVSAQEKVDEAVPSVSSSAASGDSSGDASASEEEIPELLPEVEDVQATQQGGRLHVVVVARGRGSVLVEARLIYFDKDGQQHTLKMKDHTEGIFHFWFDGHNIDNPLQYWIEVVDEMGAVGRLGSKAAPLAFLSERGYADSPIVAHSVEGAAQTETVPMNPAVVPNMVSSQDVEYIGGAVTENRKIAPGWVALSFIVGGLTAAIATTYWASSRLGKLSPEYENDPDLRARIEFDDGLVRIFGAAALIGLGTGTGLWVYNKYYTE